MSGSKDIVLRLTPALKFRLALAAMLLVILLIGFFFIGFSWGRADSRDTRKLNRQLARDYNQYMLQRDQQQLQMTQLEKSAEIDRLAAEQVQRELTDLRIEVADLKRDVEFYRGLMAPGERDKGFQLHDAEVEYLAEQNRYSFKMTLTNIGGKGQVVKGQLNIDLEVLVKGEAQQLSVVGLPGYSGASPIRLRFRFFQQVEGSFQLPEGVEPRRMTIRSDVRDASGKPFEVSRDWNSLLGSF